MVGCGVSLLSSHSCSQPQKIKIKKNEKEINWKEKVNERQTDIIK